MRIQAKKKKRVAKRRLVLCKAFAARHFRRDSTLKILLPGSEVSSIRAKKQLLFSSSSGLFFFPRKLNCLSHVQMITKTNHAEASWPAAVGQVTSPTHLKAAESFTTPEKNNAAFIFQNYSCQVLHVQKEGRKWLHHLERETEKKKGKRPRALNDIISLLSKTVDVQTSERETEKKK